MNVSARNAMGSFFTLRNYRPIYRQEHTRSEEPHSVFWTHLAKSAFLSAASNNCPEADLGDPRDIGVQSEEVLLRGEIHLVSRRTGPAPRPAGATR